MADNWIISAGITPRHEPVFVTLKNTKEEAVAFADKLAKTRYPDGGVVSNNTGNDVEYQHPDGFGGDWLFITIRLLTHTHEADVLEFFDTMAELDAEEAKNAKSPLPRAR